MVLLTTCMAWTGWVMGIRRYGVGWVDGGPLWAGFAMADGSPRYPAGCCATLREATSSRRGAKLTVQLSVFVPPAPTSSGVETPAPPNSNPPASEALCCPLPHLLSWEVTYTSYHIDCDYSGSTVVLLKPYLLDQTNAWLDMLNMTE